MVEPMSKAEKAEALHTTISTRGWQEVLKPALMGMIAGTTNNVMNNTRPKGEEAMTDEALKQRALAWSWVLGWEKKYKQLVDELEQFEAFRNQTEPADAGGSPHS